MQIFQNILYKYPNISKYFILQMKNYDKLGIIIFWLFIKITTIIIYTITLSIPNQTHHKQVRTFQRLLRLK